MTELRNTIVIERPIEEVFGFLHDPRNDAKWQPSTRRSWQTSEGAFGVGTTVRQTNRFSV